MSLLAVIKRRQARLRPTQTTITTPDGIVYKAFLKSPQQNLIAVGKAEGFVVDSTPDLQIGQIDSDLFIGSQDGATQVDLLLNLGIKSILSIGVEPETRHHSLFQYYFIPCLDEPGSCLISVAEKALSWIDRENTKPVYLHCNAGVSRAPSVAIYYLIKRKKLSFNQALKEIQRIRPAANPNSGFREQLMLLDT